MKHTFSIWTGIVLWSPGGLRGVGGGNKLRTRGLEVGLLPIAGNILVLALVLDCIETVDDIINKHVIFILLDGNEIYS